MWGRKPLPRHGRRSALGQSSLQNTAGREGAGEGKRLYRTGFAEAFLKEALELPKKEAEKEEISRLVIALRKPEIRLMDSLLYCADYLGIDRSRVHIVSHTESFVYYVMSQKRDVWSNQVGMFELSEGCARYYELKTQRGSRGMIVTVRPGGSSGMKLHWSI